MGEEDCGRMIARIFNCWLLFFIE